MARLHSQTAQAVQWYTFISKKCVFDKVNCFFVAEISSKSQSIFLPSFLICKVYIDLSRACSHQNRRKHEIWNIWQTHLL